MKNNNKGFSPSVRPLLVAAIAVATFLVSSCNLFFDNPTFDESLLVGKWVSGTEYYRYYSDGNGATWDTSDDVNEEEAQLFEWEFDSETNKLTHFHKMEMGGVVPKYYTVTGLDDSCLKYKDNYGQLFVFYRVK